MNTAIVNLTQNDIKNVYTPAEDSFLLVDSLKADVNDLEASKPLICMEIGSGSGVVITSLALACKKKWFSHFIAVDVNPEACRVTQNTNKANYTGIDIIQMDLTSAFQSRNVFDLIIFNPPFGISESVEFNNFALITKATAGGKNGREVMDKAFPEIARLLSKNGIFYLAATKKNNIEDIIRTLENLGMSGRVINEGTYLGEHCYVVKFVKK